VVGIGLVKGMAAVNVRQLVAIFAGWVLTPLGAGAVGFFLWIAVGRFLPG